MEVIFKRSKNFQKSHDLLKLKFSKTSFHPALITVIFKNTIKLVMRKLLNFFTFKNFPLYGESQSTTSCYTIIVELTQYKLTSVKLADNILSDSFHP